MGGKFLENSGPVGIKMCTGPFDLTPLRLNVINQIELTISSAFSNYARGLNLTSFSTNFSTINEIQAKDIHD
jgi:hypothetical protein